MHGILLRDISQLVLLLRPSQVLALLHPSQTPPQSLPLNESARKLSLVCSLLGADTHPPARLCALVGVLVLVYAVVGVLMTNSVHVNDIPRASRDNGH